MIKVAITSFLTLENTKFNLAIKNTRRRPIDILLSILMFPSLSPPVPADIYYLGLMNNLVNTLYWNILT